MDTQTIELIGRHRLMSELMHAGLEVALPMRDRGIDLIAYVDLSSKVRSFLATPIQMKAASTRSFSIDKKYEKISNVDIRCASRRAQRLLISGGTVSSMLRRRLINLRLAANRGYVFFVP